MNIRRLLKAATAESDICCFAEQQQSNSYSNQFKRRKQLNLNTKFCFVSKKISKTEMQTYFLFRSLSVCLKLCLVIFWEKPNHLFSTPSRNIFVINVNKFAKKC